MEEIDRFINLLSPIFIRPKMDRVSRSDFRKHYNLKAKLEKEIEKFNNKLQEMPDDIWDDEERRVDWITQDRAQWNYNNERIARLQRLYDKCFPKKLWVIGEIEAFFQAEEGPLY